MVINISGGSGNFDIQWSPTTGVSNPKSRETLAYPKTTTIYTVTVTDNLTGANTEHQIPIVVKEKTINARNNTDRPNINIGCYNRKSMV